MNIINLTDHVINIITNDNQLAIDPSGEVARVSVNNEYTGMINDLIPVFQQTTGDVQGLPDPVVDTIFIVSTQVRLALPDRMDLFSPANLIRNDQGQPVGTNGLIGNY